MFPEQTAGTYVEGEWRAVGGRSPRDRRSGLRKLTTSEEARQARPRRMSKNVRAARPDAKEDPFGRRRAGRRAGGLRGGGVHLIYVAGGVGKLHPSLYEPKPGDREVVPATLKTSCDVTVHIFR